MLLLNHNDSQILRRTYSSGESDNKLKPFRTSASGFCPPGEDAYYKMIEACGNSALVGVQNNVLNLRELRDGWNGRDALAPTGSTVKKALVWLRDMWIDATNISSKENGNPVWVVPHVSVSADGQVVFEWLKGDTSLHVYISDEEIFYIKDPGTEFLSEMEDGDASSPEIRRQLWLWMIQKD